MNDKVPEDLIYAAFFFIDIVGLSNPILSTATQRTKIKKLNLMIGDCKTFNQTPKSDLFILPTGDGMLIGFKDGLEQPISLAIELHARLRIYNQQVPDTEKIATRIGCNIGHIFVVKDLYDNVNLWGPGAILARRVMDMGNESHILLPSNMADDLLEMSDEYKNIIHPIHNFKIKHNEELLVYSVYGQDFGNKILPKKSNQTSALNTSNHDSLCQKIIFNIKVTDFEKTNLTKYERIYNFVNNSIEPIYDIQIEIMTHTEHDVKDLNIRALDENDEKLEITKIFAPSEFSKQLTVKLNQPIFRGGKERLVKILYEKRESSKFFQHRFLIDTDNFELNFLTPPNFPNKQPKFFFIDNNNNKTLVSESKKIFRGQSYVTTWQKNDKISLNDIIRLEY